MLKKKILTYTLINIGGKAFNYLFQILILTILVKTLGVNEYGIFVLAIALIGNSNLLEAGFGLSSTKYIAEYHAKNDLDGINKVISTNFLINTLMALFFAFVLFILNEFYIEKVFKISHLFLDKAKISMRILIALSFFEFWVVGFIRIMEGFKNFFAARLMENLKWFFRLALIFIFFKFEKGLTTVCWAYFWAGIIEFFIIWIIVFKIYPEIKIGFKYFDKDILKINLNFSVWIMISKLSAFIMYRLNTILLGIFVEMSYITYYNIASKIYELLKYGVSLLSSAIIPVASNLNANSEFEKLKKLFIKSTYYTVAISSPFIVFFSINSSKVITIWLGKGYEPSFMVSSLLVLSLFPSLFSASGAEIFVGIGKVKQLVLHSIIASGIGFLFMLFLISEYKIFAVVTGTFISSIMISASYTYIFLNYFSLNFSFLLKYLFVPILSSLIIILISIINNNIFIALSSVVLYFVILVFFIISKEDRKIFFKLKKLC